MSKGAARFDLIGVRALNSRIALSSDKASSE